MSDTKAMVLGVGNTLMQDDGIGVWVVRALAESYELPPSVRLVDGGIAGFGWLHELAGVEHLLIVDAVRGDQPPGKLYRLTPEDLLDRRGPTLSPHEVGLSEILSMASLLDHRPRTTILGVQPAVFDSPGLELTAALKEALPEVVAAVIEQLRGLGCSITRKSTASAPVIRTPTNTDSKA